MEPSGGGDRGKGRGEFLSQGSSPDSGGIENKDGIPAPRSLSFGSGSAHTLLVKAGPGKCGWGHLLYLG